MPDALIGVLLALGLVATVFLPRIDVPGPGVHLFRAFFPSWRFFEDVGAAPRLFYQVSGEADWHDALPPVPRGPGALLFNPRGNLRFAGGSLVDQLVADLAVTDDDPERARAQMEAAVSFRLVRRLVEARLRALPASAAVAGYRIRVAADDVDLLVTPEYSWTP